jgi:two-component system LytT family response regulator
MKLRVLIVDDEQLSRDRIRDFLEAEKGIEIVGECVNGVEAVELIRETAPDLVFLDIKMPELDGFGVVESLKGTPLPTIILVSAYPEFALQAFDIHAADYLLKPFDRKRFQTALTCARRRLGRCPSVRVDPTPSPPPSSFVSSGNGRPRTMQRMLIKSGGRISLVKAADIDWIGSADNYAELHVGDTSHLLRTTITSLVERLPRGSFLQISRSIVVNISRIKGMRAKSHGDYSILLHNGTHLVGSRKFRPTFSSCWAARVDHLEPRGVTRSGAGDERV